MNGNINISWLKWRLAAHRTPPGSSALRESEAAANVLSVRKRSDSNNKCFL